MVRNIIIYKLYLNIAKYIIQIMAQNAVTEFITPAAKKRLLKDVKNIIKNPLTEHGIYYVHDEQNILSGYACIFGPKDSLYEDGAYLFRFEFPKDYPYRPPVVTYHTNDGTTRFHPNLYRNGKVCLSILNTWKGEQWTSCQSLKTVLLTLVSLFHNKPLLCEPGLKETHRDFVPYNHIIEYKNLEVAIAKMAMKKSLPENFKVFFPFIRAHILTEKANIVSKIDKLVHSKEKNGEQYVRTYNMRIELDYKKLETLMDLAIKELN